MVPYGRSSRSSWTAPVWSSFGRPVMRKAICENPIEVRLGEGFQLGMLICTPWKRVILICVCGWHQNWLEWNKILIRCGKYSTKKLIWENQPLSLIMYTWGCTQRQCEISNDMEDNYRTIFASRISAGATTKLPCSENMSISSWSYDVVSEQTCTINHKMDQSLARMMGSPRLWAKQAAADSRGSRTCVCAKNTSGPWLAHAGGEGWINILPWYRLVGVAKTSSETQRRKSRAARKGKWPPRGTGMTVLTYPGSAPR